MNRRSIALTVGTSLLLLATANGFAAGTGPQVISADELVRLYSSQAAPADGLANDSAAPRTRGIAGVRTGGAGRRPAANELATAPATPGPAVQSVSAAAARQDKGASAKVPVQSRQAFHNIGFQSGSATISAASYAQLDEIGEALAVVMSADPSMRFIVEGHTDSIGDARENEELSRDRARSIRRFLVIRHGLDGSRIDIVGHGARHPVASNASAQGRRLNRRVEIVGQS